MTEFWQRLKRRKLVQWAIAYVAAAFAMLQGIDIVAQQFGWTESLQRGIAKLPEEISTDRQWLAAWNDSRITPLTDAYCRNLLAWRADAKAR